MQEDQGTFTVRVETANFPVVNINADFYIYDSPGTAQRGVDYQSVAKILYITPGETGAEFEVTLRKDTDDEPDKAFTIKMQQQSPADDQIILGVTEVTVTILDDDPATPTNLELANQTTDPDLDHVAVLQWDYSDAEGYLLESREGTSGSWRCIVAGTYSSQEPTGTSTVSTTKGGAMAASQNWHFRVRSFTSQAFSYPGEATCDEEAEYGYIFSTVEDQGYNLSPEDTLGPVAIPAIDPTVRAHMAAHRTNHRSRSQAPRCANFMGRTTGRQQRDRLRPLPQVAGRNRHRRRRPLPLPLLVHQAQRVHHQLPGLCHSGLRNGGQTRTSTPTGVPAQRRRKFQTPETEHQAAAIDYRPTSVPSASVTATLALSTDIFANSDGNLEYLNPPAPTGLTLETRFRGYRSDISTIIATWNDVENAPGYKVRWRETSETDWRERGRSRKLEPNANACSDGTIISTLNDGRVWCVRENGKLLTTTVTPWPWMFNAGPGKPNDNIAPARKGFGFLESGIQHEVQVATCTDQSCDATGAWSTSRYAYSR